MDRWAFGDRIFTLVMGWKIDPEIDQLYWAKLEATDEDDEVIDPADFTLDTHRRADDFVQHLQDGEEKVKAAAGGRDIYVLADELNEYNSLSFMFGTREEIINRLK